MEVVTVVRFAILDKENDEIPIELEPYWVDDDIWVKASKDGSIVAEFSLTELQKAIGVLLDIADKKES